MSVCEVVTEYLFYVFWYVEVHEFVLQAVMPDFVKCFADVPKYYVCLLFVSQ